MKKVKYVGHIESEHGVEPDPDKLAKVKNWPIPQNAEEVRQFLGFAGYYRKFIHDFSKIARPLLDIMATGKNQEARKWIQSGGGRRNSKHHLTSLSRNLHHHPS